jgi:O-antigen/teichoic acid export membrane protein
MGAASIGSSGLAAVGSVIIARQLGVTGRGQWAVISSLAILVGTFASIGLPSTAAFASARVQGPERQRIVQAMMMATIALSLVAAGIYALISLAIAPSNVPRSTVLLGAAVASSLVLQQVSQHIALTTSPVGWFAAAQFVPTVVMVAALAAIGSGLDVAIVAALSAGSAGVGAVVSLAGAFRHGAIRARVLLSGARATVRVLRPYLAFAALTFGTLALTQVVQRIDVLLVGGFRGSRDAGLYAIAVQVGDLLLVLPGALGFFVFRLGAGSAIGHWEQSLSALRWTLATSVLAATVLGIAAPVLITRLLGSQYDNSVTPLRWLLPGLVLLGLQGVISNYIASRGRPRSVLTAWLTAAILGIALDIVVIPAWGITGAAAVSSVSYLVVVMLHLRALEAVRPRRVANSSDAAPP